jgi:hypothetical protein
MPDPTPATRSYLAALLNALNDPAQRDHAAAAIARFVRERGIDWASVLFSNSPTEAPSPGPTTSAAAWAPPPPPPPVLPEHTADQWMLLTNPTMLTHDDHALLDAIQREPVITQEQRQNLATAAARIAAMGGWTPGSGCGFTTGGPNATGEDPTSRYGYRRQDQ